MRFQQLVGQGGILLNVWNQTASCSTAAGQSPGLIRTLIGNGEVRHPRHPAERAQGKDGSSSGSPGSLTNALSTAKCAGSMLSRA